MIPIIQILPNHAKRFLQGYPWIYANEIIQSQSTKNLEPGQLVQVEYKGHIIATGYFNRHSLIAFRVLSRFGRGRDIHHTAQFNDHESYQSHETIDKHFFISRIKQALRAREMFYPSPYYRLVYAEADGLPGLIIDRFNDVFVIQMNTQGMVKLCDFLIEALQTLFNPTTLYFKNDSSSRMLEGLALSEPVTIGKPLETLKVIENNTEFVIDLSTSQKTGWFYDHQPNRKRLAELAKNKTIIDYYCYSGGFSVQAAKHGATRVIGVDRSETALRNAKRSATLNGVFETCEFICRETFDDMATRVETGFTYDIVILDPPAFVKSKKNLPTGLKGYEKLLTGAIPLVASNGLLAIASCSYHIKEADLKYCLARALHKNQRQGKILQSLMPGPDHPLHPMLEESAYLKGFIVLLD